MNQLFLKYIGCVYAYTIMHKFPSLWNGKLEYNNKLQPMLLGDKTMVLCGSLILSPFLSGIWFMEDLNKLDIYMKGQKPELYGYTKNISISQHIFE